MTNDEPQNQQSLPAVAGPVQRTVRRQRGDAMPMRITVDGAVRVNGALVERDYGDCVLVEVDLHSKYCEMGGTTSGGNGGPSVWLMASQHSLHLDDSKPRDAMTEIEFYEHVGWSVFSAYGPARYTMMLTLISPDA
jgi:hypothetical protein